MVCISITNAAEVVRICSSHLPPSYIESRALPLSNIRKTHFLQQLTKLFIIGFIFVYIQLNTHTHVIIPVCIKKTMKARGILHPT